MKRFEGKTVVITGGGSGIGAATAERLLSEGAHVVVVDRDGPAASALAERLGDGCEVLVSEVTDAAAIEANVNDVLARRGRIDVLVTAAGISRGKALVDTEEMHWDEVFAVNVKGTFLWMRAVVPHMVACGGGAVVTVASQLAFGGGRSNAAYIASKGAIVSLTRTAAVELATDGVRVNSVAPGATETPLLARSMARGGDPEAARDRSRARHAMKRLGEPHEIAAAVAYLAADEASFTTGHVMLVDGGWNAA